MLVHYHLGVDVLGTCDWRVVWPVRVLGRPAWLLLEWSSNDERSPPQPPGEAFGRLWFGIEREAIPELLCRRLSPAPTVAGVRV